MRWIVSLAGAVVAAALIGVGVYAAPNSSSSHLTENSTAAVVDVELVLAVDVSYSMELDELAAQREGYAEAIVSREFMSALKSGPHGKVAITYLEWSSAIDQKVIIPWRIIDGPETADSVAAEIAKTPIRRGSRTSISGAINFGMQMLAENPYKGLRRVIDISGDGANNSGEPVLVARDAAVAQGVVINGLPVMIKPVSLATDIAQLDAYYEDCVIGGPGSFVVVIDDRARFKEAIRTKLIMEVADNQPAAQPAATILHAQARQPRVSCTIGEQLWRDRWNR
jgi:hypothetical protein